MCSYSRHRSAKGPPCATRARTRLVLPPADRPMQGTGDPCRGGRRQDHGRPRPDTQGPKGHGTCGRAANWATTSGSPRAARTGSRFAPAARPPRANGHLGPHDRLQEHRHGHRGRDRFANYAFEANVRPAPPRHGSVSQRRSRPRPDHPMRGWRTATSTSAASRSSACRRTAARPGQGRGLGQGGSHGGRNDREGGRETDRAEPQGGHGHPHRGRRRQAGAGAQVTAELVRHEFLFGCNIYMFDGSGRRPRMRRTSGDSRVVQLRHGGLLLAVL